MKGSTRYQLVQHQGQWAYLLPWHEVRRILGRDHANTAADDAKLAKALRSEGLKFAKGSFANASGWHVYASTIGAPAPQRRLSPAVREGVRYFKIKSSRDRSLLWDGEATSREDALEKYAENAGYRSYADMVDRVAEDYGRYDDEIVEDYPAKRRPKAR